MNEKSTVVPATKSSSGLVAMDRRTPAQRREDVNAFLENLKSPGSGTPAYSRH